jgi:RNA polymerase sigma factor (sigma-70 family)
MDPNKSAPSDCAADLLQRWQRDQDREALDLLLRIEVEHLKRRLRARSSHSPDPAASVSDLAQDAVARMLGLEHAPSFDTPQALRAYLWTAAARLLAERLRRARGRALTFDESSSRAGDGLLATTGGLGAVETRDRSLALTTLVGLLEPAEQQILELVYFRALSLESAAAELGVTREVAKSRCERARARLEHKLKHWVELIG